MKIKVNKIFETPNDGFNYFFGYYDKSPLSPNGKHLLAHRLKFMDRLPCKEDSIEIGYFDISQDSKREFNLVTNTNAVNWQQGSMLQWLGKSNSDEIIFNTFDDKKLVSKIVNIKNFRERTLSHPIYCLSVDGSFGLTIDFQRQAILRRAYSYDFAQLNTKEISDDTSILRIDITNNATQEILRMSDLPVTFKDMTNKIGYLEHLMISPDSNKFAFLHRIKDLNENSIHTSLYNFNLDRKENNLVKLNGSSGRLGHFCWRDSGRLVTYGGLDTKLNVSKIKEFPFYKFMLWVYRKLIIDPTRPSVLRRSITGDRYHSIDTNNMNKEIFQDSIFFIDGHMSFPHNSPDLMLFDTYPDNSGVANLLLYDLKNQTLLYEEKVQSLKGYDRSENRCDLHPKWSFCGNYFSIDTMGKGYRQLWLYNLEK